MNTYLKRFITVKSEKNLSEKMLIFKIFRNLSMFTEKYAKFVLQKFYNTKKMAD